MKSLGLVFLIFPMGAFVEPDEEELSKAEKKKRMNVFAVGPAMNIVVAVICALLFSSVFLSSASPIRDGPVVVQVGADSPAFHADIQFGAQIVEVGSYRVLSPDDLDNISAPDPGNPVEVDYYFKGTQYMKEVCSGVAITQASGDLPAANAGIRAGMILASINDTIIRNPDDFRNVMSFTRPHQVVNVTVLAYNSTTEWYVEVTSITNVTLASRNDYLRQAGQDPGDESDIGFLGVNSAFIGAMATSPELLLRTFAHPFHGADSLEDMFRGFIIYIALPFRGLAPVQSPLTDLFVVDGALGAIPVDIFWMLANSFYWIFWINLMVGMTNVLPAVPLDGGYLFRDWLDSIINRVKRSATPEERERYVTSITYTLAFFVLFLIVWQLIGPRMF